MLWEELKFDQYSSMPFTLSELVTPTVTFSSEVTLRQMSLWIEILIQARFLRQQGTNLKATFSAIRYKKRSIERKYGFQFEYST